MPHSCNLLFMEKMAVLSINLCSHLFFSFPCRTPVEYIIHNQANEAMESAGILIPASHLVSKFMSTDPSSVGSGELNCESHQVAKGIPCTLCHESLIYHTPFSPSFSALPILQRYIEFHRAYALLMLPFSENPYI